MPFCGQRSAKPNGSNSVAKSRIALCFQARQSDQELWAALAALAAAAFYLLLSGAEVATQRSFIMIGIVLIGVMVDRPTLTFRTLTVAAFGVLLLAPEAIVHPSFQMSFAATLALVAGYQQGLPWMSKGGDTPLSACSSSRCSPARRRFPTSPIIFTASPPMA